ncbi:hypothetical protein SAMD00079811_08250 [Scytonema sp. HK-05]|nr:hypothetical protein SAMD00079811_08250 [Scytonema sp. HK-05]
MLCPLDWIVMEQRFSISNKEKKELYHSELVRYGVTFDKAAEAAKILASGKPDELLTEKEIERVNEVCEAWLSKHKRYKNLNPLLAKHKRHSH